MHVHAWHAVSQALTLPGHLISAIIFFLDSVLGFTIPQITQLIANAIIGR